MTAPVVILVAAPDEGLRRSLEFALESEGFLVEAHAYAAGALASDLAGVAACAVFDDRSVVDWHLLPQQINQFSRPIVLLISLFRRAPDLPRTTIVAKPFLGKPLIVAVRDAIEADIGETT